MEALVHSNLISLKVSHKKYTLIARKRRILLLPIALIMSHFYSICSHLHTTCDPPIVHGNLNCDTIFIQHNGLVKIGSVAPDIIHHNVKTCRDSIRNLHFFAPEWGEDRTLRGQPIDIYAFGMAALETAALDIQATPPPPNGSNKGNIFNIFIQLHTSMLI